MGLKIWKCLSIGCLLVLTSFELFPMKSMSLQDAISNGYIEVTTHGLQGYTGECMQMEVQSRYKKDLELTIEPGLQFHSMDSSVQDMIVMRTRVFTLESKKSKAVKLYAMCIQRDNIGPSEEEQFNIGALADSLLLELVRYIEKKRYYKKDAAQHAIWVLTDSASMAGIYSEDQSIGEDLRLFVRKLTGQIPPWYQIEYKKERDVVFTNEPAIIHATFKYRLEKDGIITFAIYNEDGEVVQSILKDNEQKPGIHMMKIRFEAYDVPKGKYFVRVLNQGDLVEEKMFEL